MNAGPPHDTSVLHPSTEGNHPETAATASSVEAPSNPAISALLVLGLFLTALIGAPLQFVRPDNIKSTAASIVVAAALALWAWRLDKSTVVRWTPLLLVPFGLAAFALASAAWSPLSPAVSEAARWFVMGTIMFLATNAMGRESFGAIARAAHWCALILSLLALSEFWFGFAWFPTDAPPGANFGNRNFFAEFVAIVLPFSIWRLLTRSTRNGAALMGLGLGLIVVALMSTGTRSALVSAGLSVLAVAGLAWFCSSRSEEARIRASIALTGLLPAVLMVAALSWLPTSNSTIMKEARGMTPAARATSRLLSIGSGDTYAAGTSFGIRLAAWKAGLSMIADHPILGVGAGGWNSTSALYSAETEDVETVWLAHNEPLQMIAEYGIAGWAALLVLAGLLARTAVAIGRQLRNRVEVADALQNSVAVLSIVAFGLVALAGLPLHASTTCYLLALAIGYLLARRPAAVLTIPAVAMLRTGQVAATGLLVLAVIVSVQGLRSDFLVQRAGGILTSLANDPSARGQPMVETRKNAVAELRTAYDIFENHELQTQELATLLAKLGDPASVIWLADIGIKTRPHVPVLRCTMARAQAELGNFEAAQRTLETVEKTHPHAKCLVISRLDFAYRKGQFAEAVAFGQKFLSQIPSGSKPDVIRYVVDTSYRAAIRVPDIDTAVRLLNIRAERWPELRATSWMLIGQLEAARAPGQLSPAAQEAFKKALGLANAQERPQIWARVPENYRPGLN